ATAYLARGFALSGTNSSSTVSSATTLGVTGIVVSGVVGPAVAAYFSRRSERQRFARDQAQRRREDLRALVDEGAVLLGIGETNYEPARTHGR
ncbi:MAG: hypothetical protein LC808_34800, partial [Actinobacteria bacterium]|nr:hypothetical protein [Actinomycetota bacterium]